MFKYIALIKKKPGMSRHEFIDFYENTYVPRVTKMFAAEFETCRLYRRNYLVFNDPFSSFKGYPEYEATEAGAGFDVVTECMFDTREEAEALLSAAYRNPEMVEIVRADGDKFIDNHNARMYVVEVRETQFA